MALPLTKLIKGVSGHISRACEEVVRIRQKQRVLRRKEEERKARVFILKLPPDSRRAAKLSSEKGASSWLTALPLDRHGFRLHKGAFRDALSLRYNWAPSRLPSTCVCGKHFSVAYALSCGTGGYAIMRHNEFRDITARLMQEVCYDVSTEPRLQPLSNETLEGRSAIREENARVDVAARDFWGDGSQKAYFNLRVFNPCAQTYLTMEPQTVYLRQEKEKRRQYQQRICEVEHGSFTPLVFSTTGGMGRAASVTFKRLAAQIAEKHTEEAYSQVVVWKRTLVSFLTSAVVHNSTSRLSHQEDWVHFSASSSVGSEWVPSSLNFYLLFARNNNNNKFSWNTPYSYLLMYTSKFFIQLVWFSSVSHTSHNSLLSTESCPFVCESLSNLLGWTYYFLLF